jgi:hypothetical protein
LIKEGGGHQFLWHSAHCWFNYELLNLLGLLKEIVYLPDCTERNHENKLFFAEPGFQPLKIRIRKRSANNQAYIAIPTLLLAAETDHLGPLLLLHCGQTTYNILRYYQDVYY